MIEIPEASIITLDTYKRDLHVGEAFDLSENFNGRVGDEQVPLVIKFLERGKTQQFEDGLVPFISGFVGDRLDDNNVVNADTGVGVSYTGTRSDIVGMGMVKMNLPGTMFPQEGWFYGFLGLETPDHSKRVSTFNVWFHVYNGNPDMFVNKEPFRTELQKLIDSFTTDIANTEKDALAVIAEYKKKFQDIITKYQQKFQEVADDATWMMSQLDIIEAKIKSKDIATNSQLKQAINDINTSLMSEINQRPKNSDVVDMIERGFTNFDGGNPHTVADIATLKSQYPKGTSGVWVTQDTGHMYFWNANSSEWIDGGAYQAIEVKDGSITIDKLAGNAQQAIFTPSVDGLPNYDTTTRTLDFNCITDQAYFQVGNKIIQLPKNLVVKSSLDRVTSNKLIFNINSHEFSFVEWSTVPTSSEILLGTLRRGYENTTNAHYWQGTFDITIDGRQWNQRDIPAQTIFSPGNAKKPNFDTTTRQFDFGSTTTTTPTIQMGTKVIPIPNGTIAYPTEGAMNANTLRVVYNVYNSTAQIAAWNELLPPNTVVVCLVVYNYQGHPFISGGSPYTIDGNDPNLIRGNVDYVPAMDGLPTFDVKTKILDFNCYVDQGYFVYNGKSYTVPRGTKIVATQFTSTKFTFRPSDMTFYAHAWADDIPAGEVLFLSIRIGNYNNQTVTTGTVPVEIIGQSFKSNATDNPIDAKVKGINHRGFNTVAPEESRSAYLLSKRNGYHHWEGDINWTKDNVPMMIHDLAINRTARNLDGSKINVTTNLTDMLYQDLANFDFGIAKGERFKGEPLLTFEELVKLARYNDIFLHIEFKYEFTQEQVQTLHNIVVKYNMLDRIGWQAFGWDNLKPMMKLEPNGQYELLGGDVTDDYFTKMAALKTDTNTIIASQNAALSVDDIQKIADKGYPIYLWTVDDGNTVRKFRDIGMVEGIMTNGAINVADELTK